MRIFKELYKTFLLFLIYRINKNNSSKILVYSGDYIGLSISVMGKYESRSIKWIEESFNDETYECMLDVGANIGNHTYFLQKKFEKICCFEVSPNISKVLKINTSNFKNVEVFDFGLSNKNENVVLTTFENNIGGTRISETSNVSDGFPVRLYDSLNTGYVVSFIKIDVEGHELEVLEGMSSTLKRFKPIIAFEFNNVDQNQKNIDLIQFLRNLGYIFYSTPYISYEYSKSQYLKQRLLELLGFDYNKLILVDPVSERKMFNLIFAIHLESKYKLK